MGNGEAASLLPREIDDLADYDIVDISVGDSHCLALVRSFIVTRNQSQITPKVLPNLITLVGY